ncbi:MAG: hypothetical protein E7556_02625 [Ruminococcaceae bacterium]|nr:hypothetical protein [Oscillospiraceae bacterium]
MKLKKVLSVIIVTVMLLNLSGCSLNFFSTETLLKPPALSGKSGEVQEAFNKLMSGKTFLLKTPTKGDFKSSFVLYNIDNDEDEEAIVFYTDSSTDTTVRIAVLDYVNRKWILVTDIKGSGSGVYDIAFPDLDGDKLPEIVISWSLFDTKLTKMLTVYKVSQLTNKSFNIETLANEYFNAKAFLDLNSNDVNDLVIVYLDDAAAVQNSYFRAFSIQNNGSIVKFCEILLDSTITSVSAIHSDEINLKNNSYSRVFLDCIKSDTSMFTEVISWDVETLKVKREILEPSKNTLRNVKLHSRDIDSDGKIEIPVNTKFFTGKKAVSVSVSGTVYNFSMVEWKNVADDKTSEVFKSVYNPIHSYLFDFPWTEDVTVNFDKIENQTNFCIWNTDTNEVEDILFLIKFIENNDKLMRDFDDYDDYILSETETGVFIYEITPYGENFGITDEFVKSSFIKV